MKIGIIDTGIDKNHKRLRDCEIKGATIYQSEDDVFYLTQGEFEDSDGHGTGIASIIHRHCPQASLFILKLSSFDNNISEELLCEAISYFIKNINVQILNISMGVHTNNPTNRLITLCEKANKKGTIINASSYYFAEKSCFPAHFNSVFGVGVGLMKSKTSFKYLKDNPTNILAKGGFQRVANKNNSFKFGSGTSLATAHFTGIIATVLQNKGITKNELLNWLEQNSDNAILSFNRRNADDMIASSQIDTNQKENVINQILDNISLNGHVKNLAIFPFEEKEIRSLVQFSYILPYQISLAIGYPRAIKMDEVYKIIRDGNIPSTNKNLTEKEFSSFDTLVVGYFLEQILDQNLIFGYDLIKKCIGLNKNFIVWDDTVSKFIKRLAKQHFPDYKGKIYFTSIDKKFVEQLYTLAPLPEVSSPILCVIGTGSIQGKFTVQMTLKKILDDMDYRTSFISTEPQGMLFESDFLFPFGYNPPIHINIGEWSKILQLAFQSIQKKKNPEIFLTGSQGGVIPKYPINIGIDGSQLKQLAFIQGVYPDAIICTISPHDDIEFIKRTITIVQSYVECKVLFFALTPYTYKTINGVIDKYNLSRLKPNKYEEKRVYFEEALEKPVIDVLDKKNNIFIVESIQNAFSQ